MTTRERFDQFFIWAENSIYVVIGLILIISVLFLVFDVIKSFIHLFQSEYLVRQVVEVIDTTLLILMVVEILYTIRVSFKEHTLCSEPFIIVALIAAIRRILVISVETAYIPEKFEPHMIEISILGILIFIFVGSIVLIRRQSKTKVNQAK